MDRRSGIGSTATAGESWCGGRRSGSGLVSPPRRLGNSGCAALFPEPALVRTHAAHGPRIPVVDPAQIVLRVIRVGEAGKLQFSAGEPEPMVARDPLLAGVVDANAEQLAVVGLVQFEIVAHFRGVPSPSDARLVAL